MSQKIGRNERCPCGSGRKYKKCHGAPDMIGMHPSDAAPSDVTADPPRRWKPYSDLPHIEAQRRREIEEIFSDEFGFIDDCLALAARQVEILGEMCPSSVEDAAMRDVSCDAFEFLYEAKRAVSENRPSVVFPVMRRAFESISLCHLFTTKPEYARRWSNGRAISNSDVRKYLENDPMMESVDQLREEYKHFSQGTHPNRTHVPYVFLGEGNKFTLGAISPIDHLALGEQVRHLMQLCYWYVGIFLWFYRESVPKRTGPRFDAEFLKLTPRIERLRLALNEQLAKLRKELMRETKPAGIGPAFLDDKGEP